MAGNAIIGALRVVLGADTAALEKGLRDAQSSLASFGATFAKAGAVAATAFAAAAVGIGVAVKGVINDAEKLNKLSQSMGVPVEELSKLKYAADLADVPIDALATSMGKLAKNMSDAAGGAAGAAADAFKALGIQVTNTDGTLRSSSDVLGQIAQKFKGYEDGAAKTALAIALFGKAGAAMIPLLNQGRDGIEAAKNEADQFGLTLDNKTTAAAEAFNDNLKRMASVTQGAWTQAMKQALPALLQISNVLLEGKKNSELFKTAVDGMVVVFRALASVGMAAYTVLSAVATALSAVLSAAKMIGAGDFSGAFETLKTGLSTASASVSNLGETIAKFWKDAEANFSKTGEAAGAKLAAPVIEATNKSRNAIESFLGSLAKKQAGLQAELQTIGLSTGAHERLKIILEAEAIAKDRNIKMSDALREKIAGLATGYGELAQKVEDSKERFNTIKSSMEGVASKFEDALVGIADGSKSAKQAFSDMAKGILSDLLRLIIRLQITMPLAKALLSMFGGGGGPTMVFGAAGSHGVPTFGAPSPVVPAGFSGMARPQVESASPRIAINIHPGAKEDKAQTRKGRKGETIIDMMTTLVNSAVAGGDMDPSMGGRYGARPVPVMR